MKQIKARDMVYCDTDSIKFMGNYDRIFTEYNHNINDTLHLGHYEKDRPYKYDRFKTYGAKKYAYEVEGETHITVAGVPKKGSEELNSLEDFTLNKKFTKTGKKRPIHNNYGGRYQCKCHDIFFTRNITLADVEYTLDITPQFEQMIIELFKKEKLT